MLTKNLCSLSLWIHLPGKKKFQSVTKFLLSMVSSRDFVLQPEKGDWI